MAQAWKTVRVFISSTFRDMQAERDHLVRFVFPRLREQLLSRRIHLVDVDLRWGVTSEQDASEVCREIINECRPRFLCMLGGRYGTIPEGNELSITADEVHFGALDVQQEKIYGPFYFRDDAVTELMDKSSPGSIREPRHSQKAIKLAWLKRDIRKAKHQPFLYRSQWNADEARLLDLTVFGDRVEGDILATIDDEFGSQPPAQLDEFDEENAAMEAFVEERSERFVLGSRETALEELLAHANATGGNGYVCLIGAPGSGKSALLAHLYRALNAPLPSSQSAISNPQSEIVIIPHFVGASPGSTDVRRTLRRLCHELKAACPDITAEIPDDPEKLRVAFPDFLRQACARQRVVILLDAVNQFDPASHSVGLHWLPEELPANARVILSVLDGPALEELGRRSHKPREIELKPLTAEDGEAIIEQFRKRYRKKFEPDQCAALLAKTDAGTPLYLLAALEELRTLGTYEEITDRIRELPGEVRPLFVWILKQRLSNDPGFRDRDGHQIGTALVEKFVSCLGVSRHGLSPAELTGLIDPGDPLGNVAAVQRLLQPYLMWRGELLDFYHGQLREAVESKYLDRPEKCEAAHRTLADHFNNEHISLRKADELPWQLAKIPDRDALTSCLSNRGMFNILFDHNRFELFGYWRDVIDARTMETTYSNGLAEWLAECGSLTERASITYKLGRLLMLTDRSRLPEMLFRRSIEYAEHAHNIDQLDSVEPMIGLAQIREAEGAIDEAATLYRRVTNATAPNDPRAANALNNLGRLHKKCGDLRGAIEMYQRAIEIWTLNYGVDYIDIAKAQNNLGSAFLSAGNYAEAEREFRLSLAIQERWPGQTTIENTLNNLAELLRERGQHAAAEGLYRRAIALQIEKVGVNHRKTATFLFNLALCLSEKGDYAAADETYRKSLATWIKSRGRLDPIAMRIRFELLRMSWRQRKYILTLARAGKFVLLLACYPFAKFLGLIGALSLPIVN